MALMSLDVALKGVRAILLDFDGPVCDAFAGYPSTAIAERIRRQALTTHGAQVPERVHDPLALLRWLSRTRPELCGWTEEAIRAEEEVAVSSAPPTPGIERLLHTCARHEYAVVIVSNNSTAAIRKYLGQQSVESHVDAIFGRPPVPSLMKPSPHLVRQACAYLRLPGEACVLVGDSETDVAAAHAAGCRCIGYANKPRKLDRLAKAGAEAVVTSLDELTQVLEK